MHNDRVYKLKKMLESDLNFKLDRCCVLVISPINRFYFSNFYSSSGAILITKENSYLILDARYYTAALGLVFRFNIICTKNIIETIVDVIKKEKLSKVIVENDFVTLNLADKLENSLSQVDCTLNKSDILSLIITKMRSIKSQSELENIKKSQRITEKVFDHALKFIEPGMTELLVATELEFFAKKLGAKSTAFEFIIASGENSAVPHSSVSEREIQNNDVILIDIGVNFNGYMSDMSRTIFIGSVSEKQKEVYNLVLEAQNLAISRIKPGLKCSKLDYTVRKFIDSTKYKDMFLHSTGHGVGLNIHERPFISFKSEDVFEEGMVVTVEPGIYISKEFGIRIEDMVLVTKNGSENLTHVEKNIFIKRQ